jgi:hypothetical protein
LGLGICGGKPSALGEFFWTGVSGDVFEGPELGRVEVMMKLFWVMGTSIGGTTVSGLGEAVVSSPFSELISPWL